MKRRKLRRNRLYILSAVFLTAALALWLFLQADAPPDFYSDGRLRLCIDAGHGGSDPGAADADGIRFEKDDCLSMALAVEEALKTSYPDIEVLLTRTDDTYLRLEERCAIANEWNADLFISIHRNSSQSDAEGVEIWIPSSSPSADKKLAKAILTGLETVGVSKARGVKNGTANNPDANYYVLGHTDMPACLIELGFITNPTDNRLLDTHHETYAKTIADVAARLLLEK